jgi:phospholysine phosphohistidine inorganic pyrophosphate phosphatase
MPTMANRWALLIDLDGVLYEGEEIVPGSVEALAWVRARAIPHAFVTNTSSVPRRALVEKLTRLGMPAREEEIVTPAVVAAEWLRRNVRAPAALFIARATEAEFAGVPQVAADAESGAGCVVIGDLGDGWTFALLNRAFRLLMADPQAELVALGATRYWRARDGLRLDVGPFVAALEQASGRRARVLGKPAPQFFGIALDALGCPAAQAIMVGDDIGIDVRAAQSAGLRGVLVRTGKFRETDLTQGVHPDAVLHSFADLPQWWDEERWS